MRLRTPGGCGWGRAAVVRCGRARLRDSAAKGGVLSTFFVGLAFAMVSLVKN